MPKMFKKTAYARRVRRMMEKDNIKSEVEWIEHDQPRNIISNPYLRTKVYIENEVYILDHSLPERPLMADYEKIREQFAKKGFGIKYRKIEELLDRISKNLCIEKPSQFFATEYYENKLIRIPVSVYDMAGQQHQTSLNYYNNSAHDYTQKAQKISLEIESNAKKYVLKNGKPKPIKISSALVAFLKSYENALSLLSQFEDEIKKEINKTTNIDERLKIKKVNFCVNDIYFVLKSGQINITNYGYKGIRIHNDNIIVRGSIPDSVANAVIGKPVDEIIKGMPIGQGTNIKKLTVLKAPKDSISLKISQKPMTIKELIKEIQESQTQAYA